MINADYFSRQLPADAAAKGSEGIDQPTVEVHLGDGTFYRVNRTIEVTDEWVVLEVWPVGRLKKHDKEDRTTGAPLFKLDRIAVPYHVITRVVLTLRPKADDVGFKTS